MYAIGGDIKWQFNRQDQPEAGELSFSDMGHAREHAVAQHGITVGIMVEFDFEGRRLVG